MDRIWGEAFPNGQANLQHPLLRNVPPEMVATIFAMGPEAGLTELQKLQFFSAQRREQLRLQQEQIARIVGLGGNQQTPPAGNVQTPPPTQLMPPSGTGYQETPPPPGLLGPGSGQAPPPGNAYQEAPPPPGLMGGAGNLQIQRQPPREPMVNVLGRQRRLSEAVSIAQALRGSGQTGLAEGIEREIADVRRNTGPTEAVRTRAMNADAAYQSARAAIGRYVRLVEEGGTSMVPGTQYADAVRIARQNLLLQLKDIFGLGALAGPDQAILESLLPDPTAALISFGGTGGFPFGYGPHGLTNLIPGTAGARVRQGADRLLAELLTQRNQLARQAGIDEIGGEFTIRRIN
jgi:hypothetical protein